MTVPMFCSMVAITYIHTQESPLANIYLIISMLNILYNKAGELGNIAQHNALSQEMLTYYIYC